MAPAVQPLAVALVGPRAAGKTTIGRLLAASLGHRFLDGDELLAAAVGMPAGVFLERAGEPEFRRREEEVTVAALAAADRVVLALGGGAVLSAAVRTALARPGLFVAALVAEPAVLTARIARSPSARPPLTGLPPAAEVELLLQQRLPLYRAVAGGCWDTATAEPARIAELIAERIAARLRDGARKS